MDQQTLTLTSQLITGGVALASGLSGAGITAYINRLNTLDTLAATSAAKDIEYAELREREHDSWLRDQRQEAYAEFLVAAESVIAAAEDDPEGKLVDHRQDELPLLLARVRLIGTPAPIELADGMKLAAERVIVLRKQMDTASETTVYKRGESWMELTRLVGVFRADAKQYLETVRADLEAGPGGFETRVPADPAAPVAAE